MFRVKNTADSKEQDIANFSLRKVRMRFVCDEVHNKDMEDAV